MALGRHIMLAYTSWLSGSTVEELMVMKQGFSLFELLVYIALTIMILGMFFTWNFACIKGCRTMTARYEQTIALYQAWCCMVHDLTSATTLQSLLVTKSTCLWTDGTRWYGYELIDDTIIRSVGHYDTMTHRWHNRKKTKIASAIRSMTFIPCSYEHNMCGISVQLIARDDSALSRCVCLSV